MDYKDYYKVLGITKTASPDDIKKAFRKLAVRYHPDKNPGDKKAEEKFKEVNEANEVLGDPEKRKKYDELGENWKYYQQHGGDPGNFDRSRWGNPGNPFGDNFNAQDFDGDPRHFSDFFETLFGDSSGFGSTAGAGNRRVHRGQDLRAELEITLEDAVQGSTKQISLEGQKLNLKIKPGLRHGQVLRMKQKGAPGRNGGAPGDLLITINIADHPRYERRENDLYFDQELDVYTAVLGGKLSIQVIDKSIQMNIPPGTDSGKTFRLRGMGMPLYEDPQQRGDAYARILISIPKNLSEKEKDLFNQLANLKKQ